MKYVHQPKVYPDLAEESKRNIEAVNAWIDKLKGTIIAVEIHQSGQARPYADSVTSGILHLHSPNLFTTNAPGVRLITRDEAKAILRIVCNEGNLPEANECGAFDTHLEDLSPADDPCGLRESKADDKGRSHCWRFRIRTRYCD